MPLTTGSSELDDGGHDVYRHARFPSCVASETAPVSTMGSAVFFGSILFACVALTVDSVLRNDWRGIIQARDRRSTAIDFTNFASVYTLMHHASVFGLILFYAYLCEYHPPYPHAPKTYDRDEFLFLTFLLIVAACFTLKCNDPKQQARNNEECDLEQNRRSNWAVWKERLSITHGWHGPPSANVRPVNDKTEILNRDQTEEWKGWMQFCFLLYHYHHAEEVYNSIRVMITCYVWMTGFGNFSFFYVKGDYSFVRVVQMLWRLNFLVVFLCLTQGTTYILYYICLLHTYFFLMVYVTMFAYHRVNYTVWGARIKMAVLAIVIFVTWDLKHSGIFYYAHYPFLGQTPMLGANAGAMWEWYFRSSLDHWSTFLGMIFALNFPITSLWFRKLEAQPFWRHVLAKAAVGIVFAAACYWWVTGPFMHDKFAYNKTNAYFAWIPLLAYIYFRNLTPWMRNHTLDLLHQIGKTTLETYLMQHHIWLTSNAKSLLTLIPGYPKMNFLLVTVIYFTLSRRLYQLTLFLRGMVLPNSRYQCIRNLVVMAAALVGCVILAHVLHFAGILNLVSVGAFATAFGFALYRIVLQTTVPSALAIVTPMSSPVETDASSVHSDASDTSASNAKESGAVSSAGGNQIERFIITKRLLIGPFLGMVTLFICGTIWHYAAQTGASKIKPLPATCAQYVHNGGWKSIDTCHEVIVGEWHRDESVSAFGTCPKQTNLYNWGFETAPSNSLCRFQPRDAGTLLKALNKRRILFIGDSMVRHLYWSFCRQLGDKDAGAYNTTIEKWTDFSREYKHTKVDFNWAAYVPNLLSGIQNVTQDISKKAKDTKAAIQIPDLVVLGGGAWDRLHNYRSNDDMNARTKEIQELASGLKAFRGKYNVPLVWVVPTTVNTWALMTDEKREHITESNMKILRENYKNEGVLDSVDFVLDGPAFTEERSAESYDGVHYPFAVYDAGTQILANALDWVLLKRDDTTDPFTPPTPGTMANPLLGMWVLIVAFLGIFCMDSFLGLTWLAGLVVPSVRPWVLFDEAFGTLHSKLRLPPISFHPFTMSSVSATLSSTHGHGSDTFDGDIEGNSGGSAANKNKQDEMANVRRKSKNSEHLEDSVHELRGLLTDDEVSQRSSPSQKSKD